MAWYRRRADAGSSWRCRSSCCSPSCLSLGIGLLLAALNVKYRDFRYVVPFIVQFGLFVSPIAFTTADVPERWRTLYFLNPMVGIIDGFRWSILGPRVAAGDRIGALTVVVVGRRRAGRRRLVLPPHRARLRGRDLIAHHERRHPRDRSWASAIASSISRAATPTWRCATSSPRRRARLFSAAGRRRRPAEDFWALQDVSFDGQARRGARHHRPQRRRQEHAAEDSEPHHRADRRPRRRSGAASRACSKSAPAFIPS